MRTTALKYLVLCAVAVVLTAALPVTDAVIRHGPRTSRAVALTFDACSSPQKNLCDTVIVEILLKEKIPATFFIGGKWAEENSGCVQKISQAPYFEIGTHGYRHLHMTSVTPERAATDLRKACETIRKITGRTPRLFRPPYGELDSSLVALAEQERVRVVEYDLPSGDPDSAFTANRLIRFVSSAAQNGSIIVFHVNRRGWHTAEALPEIVRLLRKRGFEFKTVSDLIGLR